jgi:hypothetical protein
MDAGALAGCGATGVEACAALPEAVTGGNISEPFWPQAAIVRITAAPTAKLTTIFVMLFMLEF